jgi:flagellar motor protein MotB
VYGELASVKGVVDLTPQEALNSAETFLSGLGYATVQRTESALTVQRSQHGQEDGQNTPSLTVNALPQQDGGVQIVVRGNDQAGVQAQQAAWTEWSESLPKKSEAQTAPQEIQQHDAETHEVPLPPPPTVETQNLPPAPQPPPSYAPPLTSTQRSGMGTGTKLALGGCIGLILLGLLTVGGCFALIANVEPPADSETGTAESGSSESGSAKEKQKSEPSKEEQSTSTVSIGEPATVADASWMVTSAEPRSRLNSQFLEPKQGNFVVVDFRFTNNGSESKTLHQNALKLLDRDGREFDPDTDTFGYIPNERNIFLEQVNPGVTEDGEVIFSVAPGASGFRLEISGTNLFETGKAYVDLGF